MKKSNRFLSFFLAVVMLIGVFAVSASAEGEVATVNIKTNTDTVAAGDVITVTVNVATNYYATSMRWPVLFSSNLFELVEGTVTSTIELLSFGGAVNFNEAPSTAVNTPTYSSTEYSGVIVTWHGGSSTGITPYYQPDGMDCFTFQLKVKDDAAIGESGSILIPEDSTLFYNYILADPDAPLSPDNIVQCETLTYDLKSKTVEVLAPELVEVEDSGSVIDEENNIIRGVALNTVDNLDAYVSATAGAEVVVKPVVDNRIGTGTKVELVLDEQVLEIYTVIVAGDVNGDGLVDYTDLLYVDLLETYEIDFNENQRLAADLAGDSLVDANDKIALDSCLIFEGTIDQATGKYIAA